MVRKHGIAALRPVDSFVLRVVERRANRVDVVYELHHIGTGARWRFVSLSALKRHLARLDLRRR